MFCENCGAKVQDGAAFCSECGASTAAQPEQSARPVYAQPQPYAAPVQPPPQQGYAQPVYAAQARPNNEPLRVGQFIGMLLLMCIPIANIILMFVWAFGSTVNLNKKNYARAMLILTGVMLVFWIIAGGALAAVLQEILWNMY